jgi:hypothetical protein
MHPAKLSPFWVKIGKFVTINHFNMKSGYLLVSVLVLALLIEIGCSKGNSKTKPKLSLESINTVVHPGDSLRAMFKLTDGSGASNGSFVAIRNRLNQNPLPSADSIGLDTFSNTLPNFNAATSEIRFALDHDFLNPSSLVNDNDTIIYKFFVLTPDSVSSDTIKSPQIVILYK